MCVHTYRSVLLFLLEIHYLTCYSQDRAYSKYRETLSPPECDIKLLCLCVFMCIALHIRCNFGMQNRSVFFQG